MKRKKTLVIMGTHPNGFKTFDWSRTDCDIWMFNEAPTAKKASGELIYPRTNAVFQIHHEAIWKNPINRNDKNHYLWLSSGKTPTVYMQEKYPEVPKSIKYPIEKVISLTNNIRMVIDGKEKEFKYFSSSPDFALALVASMWRCGKKYKRVEVHGIELELESEYQYQRTGFGFWIGYLAALGIEVFLFNKIFNSPMYGYEGDVVISADQIQKRIADLTKELGDDKDRYIREANGFLEKLSGLLWKDISVSIEAELNELMKRNENAGILNGKIKESQRYLKKAKAMEAKAGASVFALGEFDGTRISYNKQYVDIRQEALLLNANIAPLLKKLLNSKKGSKKRQRALDEFGNMVAQLMNKNMLIFQVVGAIQENQYYLNSLKLSIRSAGGGR